MRLIIIGKELPDAQLGICEPKGELSEWFHKDFHTYIAAWRLGVGGREGEKSEFKTGKNQPSTFTAAQINVKCTNSQIKNLLFRKQKVNYWKFLGWF